MCVILGDNRTACIDYGMMIIIELEYVSYNYGY